MKKVTFDIYIDRETDDITSVNIFSGTHSFSNDDISTYLELMYDGISSYLQEDNDKTLLKDNLVIFNK